MHTNEVHTILPWL